MDSAARVKLECLATAKRYLRERGNIVLRDMDFAQGLVHLPFGVAKL
jgi:hypothetical protein